MEFVTNWNPLSFKQYTSLGDDYQKVLSNNQSSNLILRAGWIVCKIAGRIQDIALNVLFGTVKLTLSTAIAIYSIPAAAFGYAPNHCILAKQASRHIALALFYIADIPLSLANIVNKYPENLIEIIQNKLEIDNFNEEIDVSLGKAFKGISTCERSFSKSLTEENRRLKEENRELLKSCSLQNELINIYKGTIEAHERRDHHET